VLEVNMNCSLEYGESSADCAMYPYAAQAAGLPFPELLRRMVEDARRMHRARPTERKQDGRSRTRARDAAPNIATLERRRRR
jgi:hypothetical protein